MSESKELKVGSEVTHEINGKKITIKPVTLGKMKKAMSGLRRKNADIFDLMMDCVFELLNNGANPFATQDWIMDNVTMPMAARIIGDVQKVNGMGVADFFLNGGATPASKESRDLIEATPTPSV